MSDSNVSSKTCETADAVSGSVPFECLLTIVRQKATAGFASLTAQTEPVPPWLRPSRDPTDQRAALQRSRMHFIIVYRFGPWSSPPSKRDARSRWLGLLEARLQTVAAAIRAYP